jgi:ribosomal protein L5
MIKKFFNKFFFIKEKKIILNKRKLKKQEYAFFNLIFLQKGKISTIKKDILNFKIRSKEKLGSYWIMKDDQLIKFLRIKIKNIKKNKQSNSLIISDIIKELDCLNIKIKLLIEKKV